MVAYFWRCLIVISKDKITSYHIWKIFLQSFSHELLAANGDDDDGERDYNMKTCREQNLRVGGKALVSRWNPGQLSDLWMKSRCDVHICITLMPVFCDRTKLCECQRGWTTLVPIQNVVENFEQFLSRLIWHNLNINHCKLYICVSQRLMSQTKRIMRKKKFLWHDI